MKRFSLTNLIDILNGRLNRTISDSEFRLQLDDSNKVGLKADLQASLGNLHLVERFKMDCWQDRPHQSSLLWTDTFDNLITTQGCNRLLTLGFVTGVTSPTWYTGLIQVQQTNNTGAISSGLSALTFTVGQQVRVTGAGAAGADLV